MNYSHHKNQDTFVKNSEHEWCLIPTLHVEIDFASGWIDAKDFEAAIVKLIISQTYKK